MFLSSDNFIAGDNFLIGGSAGVRDPIYFVSDADAIGPCENIKKYE